MPRGRKPIPPLQRIMEKITPLTECGCWVYDGSVDKNGYARIKIGSRCALAHRTVWEELHGKLPSISVKVRHSCDIRCCVNPDHLSIGSQRDNVHDAINRGRASHPAGESHWKAKLTEKVVEEIRNSPLSGSEWARRLKMDQSTINDIKSGRGWRCLQQK